MFVTAGARSTLMEGEQHRFLEEEVPAFADRVTVLGLDMREIADLLLAAGSDN